jgi:2',3'-cyclic-nucleotide 2'-phosphodiesterase (5'-nucleotidase family)
MANMVGNSFSLLMIALLKYRGADPQAIGVTIALVMAGGIVGSLVAGRVIRTFSAHRIFVFGNGATLVLLTAAAVLPHPWQTGAVTSLDAAASVPMASTVR